MTFSHSPLLFGLALGLGCSVSVGSGQPSKPPTETASAAPEPTADPPATTAPAKTAKRTSPKKKNPGKKAKRTSPKKKNPGKKAERTDPETATAKRTSPKPEADGGKRPIATVAAMRKPKRQDAALEAEFKKTFEERMDWGETALAVVLMSEDWTVERNPGSGAIERRTFEVDIAGEKDDGSVMVYSFTMQQPYEGGET